MGCCCYRHDQSYQIPNNSNVLIAEASKNSAEMAAKYREEGKKLFNAKDFQNAIKAYKLALSSDPANLVNYTNLALAQKSSHKFQESILTINRMTQTINVPDTEDSQKIIVKGKITKARCQTILAKNICMSNHLLTNQQRTRADLLIQSALSSLTSLNQSQETRTIAQMLNVQKYLQNARKMKNIVFKLKNKHSNQQSILQYLNKRLKSQAGNDQFKKLNVSQFFEKPEAVLKQVERWIEQKQKKYLKNDDEQEQFTIDPIIYQQFVNPILVKSGMTYQEIPLKSHYEKNGSYDPITREPLNNEFGVRNRTLMAYIDQTRKNKNTKNQLDVLDL